MNPTKPDGQQWSIRAEFTVSPQGICPPDKNYPTNTNQDKSGIRLSYCWRTNENVHHPLNAPNWRPVRNLCKPVEYQKGSLTFTSTPPCRPHTTCGSNFEYHDSGYGSDLVSLNSAASGSSQSPINPNSRKCRSTCSIVLSSSICNSAEENSAMSRQIKYDSLNCQIPVQNKQQNRSDPCCQHLNSAKSRRLSDNQVFCTTGPHNPTPLLHPGRNQIIESAECKPYKRDVSIQTSDSLQKCSVTNLENCQKAKLRRSDKTHSNSLNRICDKHGQYFSNTRDSGENIQSPSSGKPNLAKNSETIGHTSDSSKKSRTIHIDVYCSDTDMERSDDTSSDSWENDSTSTPQTVFESPNVYVTHERARGSGLPFKLKRRARRKTSDMTTSVEMDDADIDDESTTSYPSKIDSCSTINDFSSSISSIMSWKSRSLLSCANDSVKNFNRAGTFPIMNRPILHKLNTERKCMTGDERSNAYASNPEKIGNKFQNINLERNASQEFRKHALKQQSPYDSIKENINVESEKLSKVNENEGGPQKSSKLHPYIKNAREIYHGKVINDPTGLQMLPSQYTERIASRFGEVINIFKKPGRHKGPTKNPDCCCDYCRRHFL